MEGDESRTRTRSSDHLGEVQHDLLLSGRLLPEVPRVDRSQRTEPVTRHKTFIIMNESAPPSAAAKATDVYDRWTLRDPSSISYGYYAGSVSNTTIDELSSTAAAARNGNDVDNTQKKTKGFYITTAINYTNGPAHMGHAYEAASADAIARFARLNHKGGSDGIDCYFVTGADEHGEKIAKTAEKEGKAPIEICDKVWKLVHLFVSIYVHREELFITIMCTHSVPTICNDFFLHSTLPASNVSINASSSPTTITSAPLPLDTNVPLKPYGIASALPQTTMTFISTNTLDGTMSRKKPSLRIRKRNYAILWIQRREIH